MKILGYTIIEMENDMNERQAEKAGYSFTGSFSWDKEEMKQRAKELRDKGNKAIVVNCPPNPLSRGHHGMGYSVYWIQSEANREVEAKAEAERKRNRLIKERSELMRRISEIDNLLWEISSPIPSVKETQDEP